MIKMVKNTGIANTAKQTANSKIENYCAEYYSLYTKRV
jgi:predicted RNA-binding protein with PIN domain